MGKKAHLSAGEKCYHSPTGFSTIPKFARYFAFEQLRMGKGRYEDLLRRALLIDPHTLSSPIA